MKNNKIYFLVLTLIALVGCNDDFFDTAPKTQLTNDTFWTSTDDFKLYLNSFYTVFSGHSYTYFSSPIIYGDRQSDNQAPDQYDEITAGEYILPESDNEYGYGQIRNLNILLDNSKGSDIPAEQLNPLIAEAKFFKVYHYFEKVKRFGDFKWLATELNVDSPELYEDRDSRKLVMDSILANIDYAIAHLPDNTSPNSRINRNIALALKSRIFLYEGTHMKYHGTGDPKPFLQESYNASKELIENGDYSLEPDFRTLFSQVDKTSSPEVILIKDYEPDLVTSSVQYQLDINSALDAATKSLVDSFLDAEGKPISQSTIYDGSGGWSTEFDNRDPRLSATVAAPNSNLLYGGVPTIPGSSQSTFHSMQISRTGYVIEKHWDLNPEQFNLRENCYIDAIMMRYGEVLLNYAEAAYELGILSQADLDMSINLLRARVNMPPMILGTMVKDVDSDFPSIDVTLDEIRRERRVELAMENFRYDDIIRWKAGDLFTKPIRGVLFDQDLYPEVEVGTDVVLDNEGYILAYPNSLPNGGTFEDPKHYLFPIPIDELTLNPDLTQNPGW
ncbi:RagB/SusD family nutrient uptake outer membrane protein [Arenibacter palladensis]|uniref:RagB/SusD family nutrient uptake outer membrane protein n=1 Tax=Arenibacter palladensis TaxID=237373 RepID=UPI0026E18F95|nr:RagB/SusD family nutrient uptake outer membrane protein [Arenibacter palladensis]MDO6603853.1 RagB/SusD family nutrient uptake outer membrane protein [Arenibacter palladensis]|tara:strand:- start:4070 stop:5746 length:1677 start_codon:yes stop_codon:yes gene_type:complete